MQHPIRALAAILPLLFYRLVYAVGCTLFCCREVAIGDDELVFHITVAVAVYLYGTLPVGHHHRATGEGIPVQRHIVGHITLEEEMGAVRSRICHAA